MGRAGDRRGADLIGRLPAWAAAPALAVLTWPYAEATPYTGVDGSWIGGLHLAAARGMDHGSEVLFTHGPLGFLAQPRSPVWWTGVLSLVFVLALRVALCWTLLAALRPRLGAPLAIGATFVLASAIHSETAEVLVATSLVLALLTVRGTLPVRPEIAGALVAVATLVKVTAGVAVGFFVVVAVLARAPRRLPRASATFAATFAVAWLATGGSLGDVPRWLRGSYELAAGYTAAMAYEKPGWGWHYAVAALLALALAVLAVTVPERRDRLACGVLVAGATFLVAKQGFVRHDEHAAAFFVVVGLAPLGLLRRGRGGFLAAGVVAAGASLVFAMLGSVAVPGAPFAGAAGDALVPARRAEAREAARHAVTVDPEVLAAIGDRSVHVDPFEVSAIWANDLRWRPVPVFQSYSAYTPYLDDINAAAVASRPDVVLRPLAPRAVDGRVPSFESPAYALSLVCSYRQEVAGRRWQLLARVPWRCGDPVAVGSVDAPDGGPVAVPEPSAPDRLVYARVTLDVPLSVRLRDLVLKRPPDRVALDARSFRLVRSTASQPLVLRVPDGEAVLPGAPSERDVASLRIPGWSYRVEYFEVVVSPLDCGPGGCPG